MIRLVEPSTVTPIRPSLLEALKLLGPETPAAPSDPPELGEETPAAPARPAPSGWTKIVGPRLSQVVLNMTARLAAYTSDPAKKLEAGEVTDDTAEYCADSMSLALAAWFPETALTPGKQLLLAFTLAAGEQWAGREEIEAAPSPATANTTTATPAATVVPVATTATPIRPPPSHPESVGFGAA